MSLGYRCKSCGERFAEYAPVERHVDAAHHGGRIEIVEIEEDDDGDDVDA